MANYSILVLAALLFFGRPAFLEAQDRWPVSVEAYLGVTRGFSDNNVRYRGSRSGPLMEILVGGRLHAEDRAGAFLAVHGGIHGMNLIQTADCLIAPDGSCIPWFPPFAVVSILGGWESRSSNLRVLGGPAFASSDGSDATGFVARVDAGLPLIPHVSAVTSLSTLFVPSHNTDRFYYIALGVGLRLR